MKTHLKLAMLSWFLLSLNAQAFDPSGMAREMETAVGKSAAWSAGDAAVWAHDGKPADPVQPGRISEVFSGMKPEVGLKTRAGKDARIYANYSPSVVLVVTNNSIGTGSIIESRGLILTNWHVVGNNSEVAVAFKPRQEGANVTKADLHRARVMLVDEGSDLALLVMASVPAGLRALQIGTLSDVEIGSDVHAIGHPSGMTWTYTKGIVSQIRRNYGWQVEGGHKFSADVVQTQTPINPGNSGGPLISDTGLLVGVNAFRAQGEGLNYAISGDTVQRFIVAGVRKMEEAAAPQAKACTAKFGEARRNSLGGTMFTLRAVDLDCDGYADADYLIPDDKSKPIMLMFKEGGRISRIVFDDGHDGRWDYSWHYGARQDQPDFVGFHPDGRLQASSYERYAAR